MSETGYVVWFIAMAFVIAAILAGGILAAAGLVHRPGHYDEAAEPAWIPHHAHDEDAEHHHWYDRFHLHHAA